LPSATATLLAEVYATVDGSQNFDPLKFTNGCLPRLSQHP